MRHLPTVSLAIVLCAGTASARLHGTYTVKPDSTGDFVTIYEAGHLMTDSGISGDCTFEIYGDSLSAALDLYSVAGSDSWSITFCPGPGQHPILISGGYFEISGVNNVKVESLEFLGACAHLTRCNGCRFSGCRLTNVEIGIILEECSFDTVVGNTITSPDWADYVVHLNAGRGNVVANNMLSGSLEGRGESYGLIALDNAERNAQVYHNTVRYGSLDFEMSGALACQNEVTADVRNNLFILAPPSDTENGCVASYCDSVALDYNCYYVESIGNIGLRPGSPGPTRLDWDEWLTLGFEPHGINANPRIVSSADLHLQPGSPCIRAGTPIPGFLTDIDGEERDPVHPCIGADERASGAVAEDRPLAAIRARLPTVVQGVLQMGLASSLKHQASGGLLDISGREVLKLHPGKNDVSRLAPGVYFIKGLETGDGRRAGVRKVILPK